MSHLKMLVSGNQWRFSNEKTGGPLRGKEKRGEANINISPTW